MIARRDVLKWGVIAPTLAGLPMAARAALPQGLDAMVLDRRFPVEQPGIAATIHEISGDVTRLWFDVLDLRWRQPGFVLGGVTGADALFVLEVLARDRGRRVVARTSLPGVGDLAGPVSWVIAPVHPSVVA